MHTHLLEVFARLDAQRAALRAAVERVPAARRRERPGPDRWSAAEVLEHLSLVEARFTEWVAKAIASARETGLGVEHAERVPLPAQIEAVQSDRTRPRVAPPPLVPGGTLDDSAAWAAVESARERFRKTVTAADGLALSGVTFAHPAFGSMNVYQWVEFVALHEARHTAQINEIAAQFA